MVRLNAPAIPAGDGVGSAPLEVGAAGAAGRAGAGWAARAGAGWAARASTCVCGAVAGRALDGGDAAEAPDAGRATGAGTARGATGGRGAPPGRGRDCDAGRGGDGAAPWADAGLAAGDASLEGARCASSPAARGGSTGSACATELSVTLALT
ncbi:hypothetical protein WMF18_07770 [Sorangium sp. So ce315]|uniref:hypothetical protein n=1 Tax=Sorangium sp. So ce315 TaxID=3133299 RepID=UPI003F5FEA13